MCISPSVCLSIFHWIQTFEMKFYNTCHRTTFKCTCLVPIDITLYMCSFYIQCLNFLTPFQLRISITCLFQLATYFNMPVDLSLLWQDQVPFCSALFVECLTFLQVYRLCGTNAEWRRVATSSEAGKERKRLICQPQWGHR